MEIDKFGHLSTKVVVKPTPKIDVFSCYLYCAGGCKIPPGIWGLRIDQQFLNFGGFYGSEGVEIWSHKEAVEQMWEGNGGTLSSVAYTFDLRSEHIGKNVALWLLREARTMYDHELSTDARGAIDVLTSDFQRQGASVDNISYISVVEIMRYETCMRSVFEKLPYGKKHIPHQKLQALMDGMRHTSIGQTSFGRLAQVADKLFDICCELEYRHKLDELEELLDGKISKICDDGLHHHVDRYDKTIWSEYVKLL